MTDIEEKLKQLGHSATPNPCACQSCTNPIGRTYAEIAYTCSICNYMFARGPVLYVYINNDWQRTSLTCKELCIKDIIE